MLKARKILIPQAGLDVIVVSGTISSVLIRRGSQQLFHVSRRIFFSCLTYIKRPRAFKARPLLSLTFHLHLLHLHLLHHFNDFSK